MSFPERLLDADPSDLERALLAAGTAERPEPHVAPKTLAALALAMPTSTAPPNPLPARPSGGLGERLIVAAGLVGMKHGVWAALAVVGATLLALASLVVGGRGTSRARATDAAPPVASFNAARRPDEAMSPTPEASAAAVEDRSDRTADAGGASVRPAAARGVRRATRVAGPLPFEAARSAERSPAAAGDESPASELAPPARASIDAEIRSLDALRSLLRRGEAPTALIGIEEHAVRFAGGALAHEADVLRVEALRHAGRWVTACDRAQRVVEMEPGSPHALTLRALLARCRQTRTAGSVENDGLQPRKEP